MPRPRTCRLAGLTYPAGLIASGHSEIDGAFTVAGGTVNAPSIRTRPAVALRCWPRPLRADPDRCSDVALVPGVTPASENDARGGVAAVSGVTAAPNPRWHDGHPSQSPQVPPGPRLCAAGPPGTPAVRRDRSWPLPSRLAGRRSPRRPARPARGPLAPCPVCASRPPSLVRGRKGRLPADRLAAARK